LGDPARDNRRTPTTNTPNPRAEKTKSGYLKTPRCIPARNALAPSRPAGSCAPRRRTAASCTPRQTVWQTGSSATRSPPGSRRGASMASRPESPSLPRRRLAASCTPRQTAWPNGIAGNPQSPRLAPGGFYAHPKPSPETLIPYGSAHGPHDPDADPSPTAASANPAQISPTRSPIVRWASIGWRSGRLVLIR